MWRLEICLWGRVGDAMEGVGLGRMSHSGEDEPGTWNGEEGQRKRIQEEEGLGLVTDLQGCGVGGGRQGRPPQAWSCWQDGKTRGFGCLGPCWFPVARAALPVAATGGRKRTSCRLPGREPEGDISPGRKLGVWGRQIPGLLQGQGPDSRSGVAEGVLSAARDASVTRGD